MLENQKQRVRDQLEALMTSYLATASQIEDSIDTITKLLDIEQLDLSKLHEPSQNKASVANQGHHRLFLSSPTFSIRWRGKYCFLGNTLLFRMLVRLAETPNVFISHQQLLHDVWRGRRDAATIRGVVKRLRDSLSAADMKDLAEAIDGSSPGFYRLKLV